MNRKIDIRSLLLGAFAGAVAMLCIGAATTTKPNAADAASKPRESGETTTKETQLEQVTGIGGVFFKVNDPKGMSGWYRTNLGIQAKGGYTHFTWRDKDNPDQMGQTAWRIFPTNTPYFGQATSPLMVNYRVANMERMLEQLRKGGVKVEKVEDYDYGRWAWITDPEGNRIELWEPKSKAK